jgi:hypothetical protein
VGGGVLGGVGAGAFGGVGGGDFYFAFAAGGGDQCDGDRGLVLDGAQDSDGGSL